MKVSKHFKKRESKLKEEALLVEESCAWWENKVEEALLSLDKITDEKKREQEEYKLLHLLSRSEFEQKNISRIENKIEDFLSKKKVIQNKCT